jgi:hypothetical protein
LNGLTGKSPFVTILTIDPNPAIVDPANTRVMFVGGNSGLIPQLFRSTDAGQTWTRVEYAGTGTPFVPEGDITAIEFDPGNPSIVYLGTTLGALYRTINGGATAGDWARVDAPDIAGAQISSIALDPADRGHIWVTCLGDGVTATDRPDVILPGVSHVYKTTQGGSTWTDAGGWLA